MRTFPFRSHVRTLAQRSFGAFAVIAAAAAAASPPLQAATVQAPPISIDGNTVSAVALERGSRVFVPVRGVFERLSASVTYASPNSIVVRKRGKELVRLAVGSRAATVDGVSQSLSVAPFAAHGRVMVPLRLISEAAGASVAYVPNPQSVRITQNAALAAAPAVAAAPAASAPPVAEETHQGLPWWGWLLAALALLALIFAFMRRKKEPIISTSGMARSGEPTITTRH